MRDFIFGFRYRIVTKLLSARAQSSVLAPGKVQLHGLQLSVFQLHGLQLSIFQWLMLQPSIVWGQMCIREISFLGDYFMNVTSICYTAVLRIRIILCGSGFGSSKTFWILSDSDSDTDSDPKHWWEGEALFARLHCSDSNSDPAKSYGFFRIRIRIQIRNTDERGKLTSQYYVVQIRIQQKVSDSFGFGYGFRSATLMRGGSSLRDSMLFECPARACAPLPFILSHSSIWYSTVTFMSNIYS
jgi:hypothetical protein